VKLLFVLHNLCSLAHALIRTRKVPGRYLFVSGDQCFSIEWRLVKLLFLFIINLHSLAHSLRIRKVHVVLQLHVSSQFSCTYYSKVMNEDCYSCDIYLLPHILTSGINGLSVLILMIQLRSGVLAGLETNVSALIVAKWLVRGLISLAKINLH